jgi:hypothetical protein
VVRIAWLLMIARAWPVVVLVVAAIGCERRAATLGFWFEDVSFQSPVLGGALTEDDLRVIERVAREELAIAFGGLDLALSDRKDARYRVRVTQTIRENRMRREAVVAGESRGVPWLGGMGAVNFTYFASGAIVFAPSSATRADIIAAIGRGLGRGAVHEFAHQLIRGAELHESGDRGSYEYYAASREEQYYGAMHWDIAGPLLEKKYGAPGSTARR